MSDKPFPKSHRRSVLNKVNVFITVDTEHSIGGAFSDPSLKPVGNDKRIYGRIDDREYGIPLIMDIADRYSIPVTFFVEVLNKYYFGEEETRGVCDYILRRGHDVQLHLHPNYMNFAEGQKEIKPFFPDFMHRYSYERQKEILLAGMEYLESYGVENVTAFRAGCFGANEETLAALDDLGFKIDSSYNQAYLGTTCAMKDGKLNDATRIRNVLEIPITNFVERSGLRPKRYMPLDVNGVGFGELRYALNWAHSQGARNVTVILHSFSFIKAYDVQYRRTRPRYHAIRRFERLCKYLLEHRERFNACALSSVKAMNRSEGERADPHRFAMMPAHLSIIRAVAQLKDNIT